MIGKGSALCNEQIVPSIFVVYMRCFNPFASSLFAIPYDGTFSFELKCFRIQFAEINPMVTFIMFRIKNEIASIPDTTIMIKKKTGVDTVCVFYEMSVTPWSRGIFRSNNIVITLCFASPGYKCIDNIKDTIVVSDCWSPKSKRCFTVVVIQLLRSGNPMTNLLSVNQVFTVEDRKTGKIHEGRGDHIIIIPYTTDRGIWIKTGENRILIIFVIHCMIYLALYKVYGQY